MALPGSRARTKRRAAAVFLFALAAGAPAALASERFRLAQSPAAELLGAARPEAEAQDEASEEPKPIPLAEVAASAEQAERRFREMRPLAEPLDRVLEIERRIDERTERIDEGLARTEEFLAEEPDLNTLRDLEQAWRAEEQELSAWRETLTSRATALETRVAELTERRGVWEATERQARESNAPASLLQGIESVLGELDATRDRLGTRSSEVISLQNRVAQEQTRIAAALDRIATATEQRRSALLERDRAPLWKLPTAPIARPDLIPDFRATLAADLKRVTGHFARRGEGLLAQGLVFAGVLAVLLQLRRRSRSWHSEDTRHASGVVWELPYSTALLLLILLNPWFHPSAPTLVRNVAGLVVLAPLLRILPRLLPETLAPALRVLLAFYVVDQLRVLWEGAPVGERLLFLAETAVAAGLLAWLLRPARLRAVPRGMALPAGLSGAMRLAAGVLVASLAANVLGFVALAKLLGQGVLWSAYAAVLFYGGMRIVDALLRVVLESRVTARVHMVRRHRALLEQRASRLLVVFAFVGWAVATLEAFSLRAGFVAGVRSALDASLGFGAVSVSVGGLVAFALTVVAAIWISRAIAFVLEEDVFPRVALQRGVPGAISATARYAILLGGFFLAVAAAGVDLQRFTILAGALGVGIGFGLQNVVNNFVSGLILLYERPIQVGDAIQVGELFGEVRRIGIRSSTVRNWEGAEVIVPNADLISVQVTNWTLSDRHRRMTVKVGVAYGSDPEKVLEILLRVARAHPEVLSEPPPFARFVGFGESSLDFELWAHTERFERFWPAVNDVYLAIHAELRAAGLEIPFPQRDLHLRSAAPEATRGLRGDGALPRAGRRKGDGESDAPRPDAAGPPPGAEPHTREEDP